MHKPINMKPKNFAQHSFWQKNKYLIIGLSSVIILGLAATGIIFYNQMNRVPDTTIVALESKRKTKPTESNNLKTLAEARLEQLTNGVNLSEIEDQIGATSENFTGSQQFTNSPSRSLSVIGSTSLEVSQKSTSEGANSRSGQFSAEISEPSVVQSIDSEKAQEIVEKNEINDTVAFYSKNEITRPSDANDQFLPYFGYGYAYTSIDYTQPVEIETWLSANYYKSISRQNGEIKDFYLSTPDFYLMYLGGDYAIQENYDQRRYLGGIYEDEFVNPEIEFLRYLLSDDSKLKTLGTKTIDGVVVDVFEYSFEYQDTDGQTISHVTKYFVDQENFVLQMVENLVNDQVIYREKSLDSQELNGTAIVEEVYKTEEISEVEVKETSWQVYQYNPDDFLLQSFIKKYDIYYSEQIPSSYLYASDHSLWQNQEFYDLFYSQAFNPALTDQEINSYQTWPLASYHQEYTSFEIRPTQYFPNEPYEVIEDERIVEVELGNRQLDGRAFRSVYSFEDGFSYGSEMVEFEVDGLWYLVSQWDLNYTPTQIVRQNPFRLEKLSPKRAQELDQIMAESVQSLETIKPVKDAYLVG